MTTGSGPSVSSPRNPRIQRVRKLHRRSHRTAERAFLLEGPVPVLEALRMGHALEEVLVQEGAPTDDIEAAARGAGVPLVRVSRGAMEAASDTVTPQGVLAVARMPDTDVDALPRAASFLLVLAGISDPGNAGTLVRSAVAAGCDAVVFLADSVDPFGPKTVRASAGAILGTAVVRDVPWPVCRTALRDRGLRAVGAVVGAERSLDDVDLAGPVAVLVGSEAAGLEPEVAGDLDELVSIPMPGPVASLNAAVAGSIVLFEAARQARAHPGRRPVSSDDG